MASIVTTRYTDPTADAMALIMRRVLGTLSVEFDTHSSVFTRANHTVLIRMSAVARSTTDAVDNLKMRGK